MTPAGMAVATAMVIMAMAAGWASTRSHSLTNEGSHRPHNEKVGIHVHHDFPNSSLLPSPSHPPPLCLDIELWDGSYLNILRQNDFPKSEDACHIDWVTNQLMNLYLLAN